MPSLRSLLLLSAAAALAATALCQNIREVDTPPVGFGTDRSLTIYMGGAITKPSPGHFYYAQVVNAWQTNGTGWGRSAEYRVRIHANHYGGLMFSETPSNGTLYMPGQRPFSWFIRRYECDVLWAREFTPIFHRATPYITAGGGAIVLNGGKTESGWDRQAAIVSGAGSDLQLGHRIRIRAGFTTDILKASTYSDRFYRSSWTVMVEPRIGFVYNFESPHRN